MSLYSLLRPPAGTLVTYAILISALRRYFQTSPFQSLEAIYGVTQDPRYHQWDVLEHSLWAFHQMAITTSDPTLRLAALLHDIGKPKTRVVNPKGEISFIDHDKVGADILRDLLPRLVDSGELPEEYRAGREFEIVVAAAEYHMRVHWLADGLTVTDKAVRKLAHVLGKNRDAVMLTCRIDRRAKGGTDIKVQRLDDRMGSLLAAHPLQRQQPRSRLLKSEEIVVILGKPGPLVGEAQAALAYLEEQGTIVTKEQAEEFVRAQDFDVYPAPGEHGSSVP